MKTKEYSKMAIAGFICSFFSSLLGWIFSGIGLHNIAKYDLKGKGLSIAGIIISSVNFIIGMIIIIAIMGL